MSLRCDLRTLEKPIVLALVFFANVRPSTAQISSASGQKADAAHMDFIGEDNRQYVDDPQQSDCLEHCLQHRIHQYGLQHRESSTAPRHLDMDEAASVLGVSARPRASASEEGSNWFSWILGDDDPGPKSVTSLTHWVGPTRPTSRDAGRDNGVRADDKDEDISRYSLWAGLNVPTILPVERVAQLTRSRVSTDGRTDYNRKILGLRDAMVLGQGHALESEAIGPKTDGMFLGIEMTVAGHLGDYRGALAEISRMAGFIPDARVAPEFLDDKGTSVQFWGWIPAAQLHSLVNMPDVARVELGPNATKSPADLQAKTGMLVALRVPPSMLPQQMLEASLARLAREDDFLWKRTIGIQRIPNSNENAVIVSGNVPVRNLGRLLADPVVVKMMPAPGATSAPLGTSSSTRPSAAKRFVLLASNQYQFILVVLALLFSHLLRVARRTRRSAGFRRY